MEPKSYVASYVFLQTLLASFCCANSQKPPIYPGNRCGSELQQIILDQVFANYNPDVRPPPGDNATVVTAYFEIGNIVWVNEKTHQWKVDLFFHQTWNDPRLQYINLVKNCPKFQYLSLITQKAVDRVWKPNLFFPSELEGTIHQVIQPNVIVRIHPNGDIFYSAHVQVTLYSSGNGSKRGEYLCPMNVFSYGLTTADMILQWGPQTPNFMDNSIGIILEDHVLGPIDTFVTTQDTLTGQYSVLVANFHFLRKACLE